jgi:predicted AAA+ superfamily ATPase
MIEEALTDTPVVFIMGARQVGNSTLTKDIATSQRDIISLDDQATRIAANSDPAGFVAALGRPVLIDEVQRSPAG